MRATDVDHLKRGSGILVACLVQALRDGDPTIEDRFLKRVVESYGDLRSNRHGKVRHELELLAWTYEVLSGSSIVDGDERRPLDS